MRLLLFVCVVVLAGCCSSWRAGTPEIRGAEYDPASEPWAEDGVKARRETRECWQLFAPRRETRWVYANEPGRMIKVADANERIEHASIRWFGDRGPYGGDDPAIEFLQSTEQVVVCINPFVYVTYPKGKWGRSFGVDIDARTSLETGELPRVWYRYGDGDAHHSTELEIESGESRRFRTDWGALVFSRNGDRYLVTTEGHE